MSYGDRKDKSIDARCAELKEKIHVRHREKRAKALRATMKAAAPVIPARIATQELMVARLRKVKEVLGMSLPEFAHMLGKSVYMMEAFLKGRKPVSLTTMKLLEFELHKRKKYRRRKPEIRLDPVTFTVDEGVRKQIIVKFSTGTTKEDLAREFALRPEAVEYYLKDVK
jgi:transcriptional regulator with XRE-family HTH domain